MRNILQRGTYKLTENGSLLRNDFGEGSYTAQLYATPDNGDADGMDVDVNVSEREISGEELDDLFELAMSEINEKLPGENKSLDEVRSPLNLIESAADGEVSVEWEFDSYKVVDASGNIREDNTTQEGTPLSINAQMTYKDITRIYQLYAMVYPPILTEKEGLKKAIEDALNSADKESASDSEYILPEETSLGKIKWDERADFLWLKILVLGIGISAIVFYESFEELNRRSKRRKDQLLTDYPGIVEKLSLLMGAGMSVRKAFEKMAENYSKEIMEGGEIRYAYEEMLICCYRMRDGIGESRAIDEYGEKCSLSQYRKLSSLITSNMKLGAEGMVPLMDERAKEAFEERANLARKKGEEADTKMLFPMILLLAITIVIVVMPGFIGFNM